jgi:chromosomal replication initiation ATPase DnaA
MEVTAPELWARIQEIARGSVPDHAFHTWIASAKAVASTSDELMIEAQNPFHVEWLEDKFGPLLRSAGERVLGRPLQITVRCSSEPSAAEPPSL